MVPCLPPEHRVVTLVWYVRMRQRVVSIIVKEDLFNQYFVNRATGQTVKAGYYIVFQFIMFHEGNLAMLLLLCGVMAVVVSLFFLCLPHADKRDDQ